MLQEIGVDGLETLFQSIPQDLRLKKNLNLPPPLDEEELRHHITRLSQKNIIDSSWISFLGAGAYAHTIPSATLSVASRSEFVTAYTPYQAEVSQGNLQAFFEYQTMIADIFDMEIANASLYDGSTATAEAVLMAQRLSKKNTALIADSLHPEYKAVMKTYLKNLNIEVIEIPSSETGTVDRELLKKSLGDNVCCFVGASPNFFGILEDFSDVAQCLHEKNALLITTTPEPLALGLAKSPGSMGADIAVGEGRSFGIGLQFGGPSLGLFTTKKQYVRQVPGRLVGETVDHKGQRGFVITCATREQHIRREKATSNICTNVALCTLYAAITLALWGKEGFQDISKINWVRAEKMKQLLTSIKGVRLPYSSPTFNEFVVELPTQAKKIIHAMRKENILMGVPLHTWYPDRENQLLMCVTEKHNEEALQKTAQTLKRFL